MGELPHGCKLTDLPVIPSDGGSVLHFIKRGDSGFVEFGEAYFSKIEQGVTRAWKMHYRMTLNLAVPVGRVLFCLKDLRDDSPTRGLSTKVFLEDETYRRLTVSPRIWFGFMGIGKGMNLICNQADLPHDPKEVVREPFDFIKMDWSIS